MILLTEQNFKYLDIVETFEFCKIAGDTDFNLNKEQVISGDYSLPDDYMKLVEEIYFEVNHENKTEKIQEVIRKLIDKERTK